MKKPLLDMLVCPVCLPDEIAFEAVITEQQHEDITEGALTCPKCGRTYPIREGIAFLDPSPQRSAKDASKYETAPVVSSYLWSHYGDILGDPEASPAYAEWAGLVNGGSGAVLDIGSAVGRFTFEMSRTRDFAVGIDNSVAFIRAARELMLRGRKAFALRQEGLLTREETVVLPESWQTDKVEFIVGNALALPFRSRRFAALASLNIADKVRLPLKHLQEANRVAREREAQFVLSDPFSWSTEVAGEEDWLGGKATAPYAGRGIDNITALLTGKDRQLLPSWHITRQGHVWWKIRTHANHFELIRSCFVKAER
jgi:uncharacterized protein YbaR (Trm112 family)